MGLKNRKRLAMTLVELMVVMAIVIMFAAITAAFYPANQADRELSRFSNSVQSALLSARNRARADRLPTGIRFYADTVTPTRVGNVVLIQKPAPVLGSTLGPLNLNENPPSSGNYQLDLTPFPTDPLTGKKAISDGDFFTLPKGEVGRVAIQTINMMEVAFFNNDKISSGFRAEINSSNTSYKLFKSVVELTGDKPFELSDTIEISFPILNALTNVPFLSGSNYFDVLFNPDGSLQNTLTNDVFLQLHNFEAQVGDYSRDAILAVRRITGSIGVYEVGPIDLVTPANSKPYLFAMDPRNKGI